MRRRLAATLAAALVLVTAACGEDGGTGATESEPESLTGVTVTGDVGTEAEVKTTEAFDAAELTSAEVVVGEGETLADDSVVEAKIGIFNRDGKLVQGNYEGETTEQLDLSETQVPWIGELVGAHVGSRVAVAVPVDDVLGPDGAPQAGLAPGDPMLFVVDLMEEAPPAEPALEQPEGTAVDPPADAPRVVGDETSVTALDFGDAPKAPPTKFQVIPLIEGEGPKVETGQQVTVNYFGTVWGNGDKPFDSSFERGEPAEFPLAEGSLIDGWVKGLAGTTVGSRVMLIIPPELGYGAQGSGPDIPGDSTLVFVIDVLAAG